MVVSIGFHLFLLSDPYMYRSADIGSVEQGIGRFTERVNPFVRLKVQRDVICCCGTSRERFQNDRWKRVIKVTQANERSVNENLKQIIYNAIDGINMHRGSHMWMSTHF